MKMKDLQKKNVGDLQKLLKEKREELQKMRFNLSGTRAKNGHAYDEAKKAIARILTLLNQN